MLLIYTQCLYSLDGFQDEVTIHVGNTENMNRHAKGVFMYVGVQQGGHIVYNNFITFQVGM